MSDAGEISSTTQKFLDIFDITNNVVVLKDGTISLVMVISAMNFGLLAEQEQDAIIYAYAALLNSLNFPIQIIISSKTKDATAYLRLLDEQAAKASTLEKKDLIGRYQQFVGQLIKERNVLDKKFYVVVPAAPAEVGMITPQTVLPGKNEPVLTREQKAAVIEKGLGVLEPRRDHLIAQFNRIGLYARQLDTQEIIEIFYNSYNPEAYEGQQITDSKDYTTMVVQAKTIPDADSLKALTTDNNSSQEQVNSLTDIPPAGIAEITESAVVPKEIPDMPQNTPPANNVNIEQTSAQQPIPEKELPKPQLPTQQTVFQAEVPSSVPITKPQPAQPGVEKTQPIVPELKIAQQPKVEKTMPPVAEL
ncbi:MAG: hypothetical protein ACOZAK_04660 [Patescibacteria group bacterium]